MVYYGAWEQFADYERPGVQLTWDNGASGGAGGTFQDDSQNPRMPLTGNDSADINQRLTEASAAAIISDPAGQDIRISGWLPGLARAENGYKVGNGARRIGPRAGATDPPTWLVPAPFEWPEGATGYEWSTPTGTVVAAALECGGNVVPSGAENNYADTDADGERAKIGNWDLSLLMRRDQGTLPLDYDGTMLASWAYPANVSPVTGYFDVSGVALENDGRFILLGKANAAVTEFDLDENDGHWGCSLNIAIQETVASGSSQPGRGAFAVHYTIRPPLFRWIYEKPPTTSIPPLRQFPRDDNLGTASAARTWPVSSQQGSLRRHGYF